MRAVVVALSDLGRSARMIYHAQALAALGVNVDLVGLEGTPLPKRLTENPGITVHRLKVSRLSIRQNLSGSPDAVVGLFDAGRIGARLRRVLNPLKKPDLVIVQNPPAFPTLEVTWSSLHSRGVRFVI